MSEDVKLVVGADTTPMESQIKEASRRVGSISLNVNVDSKGLDSLSRPLGRLTGQADEFTKSMEAANARVLAFGASVGVINGISAAFKNLISSTLEVEQSLAEISATGGKTFSDLQKVSTGIFDIAKRTGLSFKDAAEATLEFSRQGKNLSESLQSAQAALVLTRTTGMDAAEAVKGLTAAVNAFNEPGLNMVSIVNKLAAVDSAFAVSSKDLIEGISRSASVAQEAGVSFNELTALITTLQEKTGRGGAVIGNAIKTIFTRVQNPEILKDIKDLGIAVENAADGSFLPAINILQNLANNFDRLDGNLRKSLLLKVGGGFQIDKLAAILNDLKDANGTFQGSLATGAGATFEAYDRLEKINKTVAGSFQNLLSTSKELGSNIGRIGFSEDFIKVLEKGSSLIQGLNESIFGNGEEQGKGIGTALLKGIGSVVSGPGLAVFLAIIAKLGYDFLKFGATALQTQLGISTKAKEEEQIRKSILTVLDSDSKIREKLNQLDGDSISQAKVLLGVYQQQVEQIEKRKNLTEKLAPLLREAGVVVDSGGAAKTAKGAIGAADGYVPNLAQAISNEREQAPKGSKILIDHNFPMGGGQRGTMVYNSNETRIRNFAGSGGDAIIPNYPFSAANGYTPNFARKAATATESEEERNRRLALPSLGISAKALSVAGITLAGEATNIDKTKGYPLSYAKIKKYEDSPLFPELQKYSSFFLTDLPVGNAYRFRKKLIEKEGVIKDDFVSRANQIIKPSMIQFFQQEIDSLGLKPGKGLGSSLSNLKFNLIDYSQAGHLLEEILKAPALTDAERFVQYKNQSNTSLFDVLNLDPDIAEAYGLPRGAYHYTDIKLGERELRDTMSEKALNQMVYELGGSSYSKKIKNSAKGYIPNFAKTESSGPAIPIKSLKTEMIRREQKGSGYLQNTYDLDNKGFNDSYEGNVDIVRFSFNKTLDKYTEDAKKVIENYKIAYKQDKKSKNSTEVTKWKNKYDKYLTQSFKDKAGYDNLLSEPDDNPYSKYGGALNNIKGALGEKTFGERFTKFSREPNERAGIDFYKGKKLVEIKVRKEQFSQNEANAKVLAFLGSKNPKKDNETNDIIKLSDKKLYLFETFKNANKYLYQDPSILNAAKGYVPNFANTSQVKGGFIRYRPLYARVPLDRAVSSFDEQTGATLQNTNLGDYDIINSKPKLNENNIIASILGNNTFFQKNSSQKQIEDNLLSFVRVLTAQGEIKSFKRGAYTMGGLASGVYNTKKDQIISGELSGKFKNLDYTKLDKIFPRLWRAKGVGKEWQIIKDVAADKVSPIGSIYQLPEEVQENIRKYRDPSELTNILRNVAISSVRDYDKDLLGFNIDISKSEDQEYLNRKGIRGDTSYLSLFSSKGISKVENIGLREGRRLNIFNSLPLDIKNAAMKKGTTPYGSFSKWYDQNGSNFGLATKKQAQEELAQILGLQSIQYDPKTKQMVFVGKSMQSSAAKGFIPNFAYDLGVNKNNIAIRSVTAPFDEQGNRIRGSGAVKEAILAAIEKAKSKGFNKISADIISDSSLNAFTKYFGSAVKGKNVWEISDFKNAANGFIPNFSNPIHDAVKREQSQSGLSLSQISVTRDSRLSNSLNPSGFAVINKRDEPNGVVPSDRISSAYKNAGRGFIPNFADLTSVQKGVQAVLTGTQDEFNKEDNTILNQQSNATVKAQNEAIKKATEIQIKVNQENTKFLETLKANIPYSGGFKTTQYTRVSEALTRYADEIEKYISLDDKAKKALIEKISSATSVSGGKIGKIKVTNLLENTVTKGLIQNPPPQNPPPQNPPLEEVEGEKTSRRRRKRASEENTEQQQSLQQTLGKLAVFQAGLSFATGALSSLGETGQKVGSIVNEFGQGLYLVNQSKDLVKSIIGEKQQENLQKLGIKDIGSFGGSKELFKKLISSETRKETFAAITGESGAVVGGLRSAALIAGPYVAAALIIAKGASMINDAVKAFGKTADITASSLGKLADIQKIYTLNLNEEERSKASAFTKRVGNVEAATTYDRFFQGLNNLASNFFERPGAKTASALTDLGFEGSVNTAIVSQLSASLTADVQNEFKTNKKGRSFSEIQDELLSNKIQEISQKSTSTLTNEDAEAQIQKIKNSNLYKSSVVASSIFPSASLISESELSEIERLRSNIGKQVFDADKFFQNLQEELQKSSKKYGAQGVTKKLIEESFLIPLDVLKSQINTIGELAKVYGQLTTAAENKLAVEKELLSTDQFQKSNLDAELRLKQSQKQYENEVRGGAFTFAQGVSEKIINYMGTGVTPEYSKQIYDKFAGLKQNLYNPQKSTQENLTDLKSFIQNLKTNGLENQGGTEEEIKKRKETVESLTKEVEKFYEMQKIMEAQRDSRNYQIKLENLNTAIIQQQNFFYNKRKDLILSEVNIMQKAIALDEKRASLRNQASDLGFQRSVSLTPTVQRENVTALRDALTQIQRDTESRSFEDRKANLTDLQTAQNFILQRLQGNTAIEQLNKLPKNGQTIDLKEVFNRVLELENKGLSDRVTESARQFSSTIVNASEEVKNNFIKIIQAMPMTPEQRGELNKQISGENFLSNIETFPQRLNANNPYFKDYLKANKNNITKLAQDQTAPKSSDTASQQGDLPTKLASAQTAPKSSDTASQQGDLNKQRIELAVSAIVRNRINYTLEKETQIAQAKIAAEQKANELSKQRLEEEIKIRDLRFQVSNEDLKITDLQKQRAQLAYTSSTVGPDAARREQKEKAAVDIANREKVLSAMSSLRDKISPEEYQGMIKGSSDMNTDQLIDSYTQKLNKAQGNVFSNPLDLLKLSDAALDAGKALSLLADTSLTLEKKLNKPSNEEFIGPPSPQNIEYEQKKEKLRDDLEKRIKEQTDASKVKLDDQQITKENVKKSLNLDTYVSKKGSSDEEARLAKQKVENFDTTNYTFSGGVQKSLNTMQDNVNTFKNKLGEEIPNAFRDGLVGAMKGAMDMTKPFKQSMLEVANTFLGRINDKIMGNLADKVTGSLFSPLGLASGGPITGGSGNKDDVPAMLMGGEYVINKSAVSKYGPTFFNALNSGKIKKFASGGWVESDITKYQDPNSTVPYGQKRDQGLSFDEKGSVIGMDSYTGSQENKADALKRAQSDYYARNAQNGQGGFYMPGQNGMGGIVGQRNLLAFATQQTTGTQFDKISGSGNAASIDIGAGSSNLSLFALRDQGNIRNQEYQKSKEQAKDLYFGGVEAAKEKANKEEEIRQEQERLKQEARTKERQMYQGIIRQMATTAAMAGISALGSAALGGGSNAVKAANAQAMENGGKELSGMDKFKTFAGGMWSGGTINKETAGGLANAFNSSGYKSFQGFASGKNTYLFKGNSVVGGSDYGWQQQYNRPGGYWSSNSVYMRAAGGYVPGNGMGDNVPTMLNGGEFVMSKQAAQNIGMNKLQQMNSTGKSQGGDSDAIVAKLDELVEKLSAVGSVNITVNSDSSKSSEKSNDSNSNEQTKELARKIKEVVLNVLRDEKRLGGMLR